MSDFPFSDLNDYDPDIDTLGDCTICDQCSDGCLTFCRYEPLPNEPDFFRLIDAMVHAINLLEAEVVRTRQVLACYLPVQWAEGLREDIFCNLSGRFIGDHEPYDRYVDCYQHSPFVTGGFDKR